MHPKGERTAMGSVSVDRIVDEKLWRAVREGDEQAFEQVVLRHQALVCGVAYNTCGNLALSEDVAQETFWAAWRQRHSLIDPSRLKSWLCGIARNLAANARRRSTSGPPVEGAGDVSDDAPGPDDVAMSREEEDLLWSMLEAIPPTYREPLILYYRQDQSVAEVAACLDLSEDAVKQRLARGRSMLRDRIADRVESGLRRSRPGRSFTAGVMAGLSAGAWGAKPAVAGTTAAGGVAKGAITSGVSGGLLGSLVGLAGGWFGSWLPAQMAPTVRERDLFLRAGRRMLVASIVFLGLVLILIKTLNGSAGYLVGWGVAMVAFQAYVAVEVILINRGVRAIRESSTASDEPNPSAVLRGATMVASRFRGRVYRSRASFLGLPLLDVQVADPTLGVAPSAPPTPRVARGWVAIGDDARGILLAVGSRARGLVAIGGVAIGGLSMGGASFGVVAFGGLAVGLIGVGGLAMAVLAFGGGAVGWQAFGGVAIAWELAVGGGAFAWNTASGGAAVAHGLVVRDLAALDQPAAHIFRWTTAHMRQLQMGFAAFAVVASMLPTLLMYRRRRGAGVKAPVILLAAFLLASSGCSKAESPDRVSRFTLDNGLTVLVRPIAGATRTALVVFYNVGGDHDPEGRSGLAHMVEHVYVTAAAGATPAQSADAFFRRYPAGCNAQTGDRYTVFSTVFLPDQLDEELRETAARMAALDVKAADLDRERPRLLGELANMFERIPALAAINNARELVRPTPRGGRRGGLPAAIGALTVDDVRSHWDRYYKPRNAVLAAAGAIEPATFRAAVTRHFGPIPAGDAPASPGDPGSIPADRERNVAAAMPPGASATACVAVAPPQPGSPLYAPYLVLASRLMRTGGAGETTVHLPPLDDPSLAAISTSARPGESGEQAAGRVWALLDELVKPELRPGETAEVGQMLGFLLGTADLPDSALAANPYGVAFGMGRREQLGLDSARLKAAIEATNADAVREAATDVFGPTRRARIVLAPRP
jgi:zinc protease